MLKRPGERTEGSPTEKVLPSREERRVEQDKLLELINLGVSLLADKRLENRNSVAADTFYEADGKISATPVGFTLIGFLQSVEKAVAEYHAWQKSGGRWEGDFVKKVAELTKLHNGLLHAINKSASAGQGVTHTLSNHNLTYDGWSDLMSQGYTESPKLAA